MFLHGQLYIAFLKARRASAVKVQINEGESQGTLIRGCLNKYTNQYLTKYAENKTKNRKHGTTIWFAVT